MSLELGARETARLDARCAVGDLAGATEYGAVEGEDAAALEELESKQVSGVWEGR